MDTQTAVLSDRERATLARKIDLARLRISWTAAGEIRSADGSAERSAVRLELERRRAQRIADALSDTQALERNLERAALAEIHADGRIIRANAAERRNMRELAIARRRDALTRASAYPMEPDALRSACWHAALAAKVPADARDDVSQALAAEVCERYGARPLRSEIGAAWLKRRALSHHIDQERAAERATGAKATAAELERWHERDRRAAMNAAASGDFVWHLAAERAAPQDVRPMLAGEIARTLEISPGQAGALALAINTRHIRPLTSTERVQWKNARAAILKRYPNADALRIAVRPLTYSADLLWSAAERIERQRAAILSRGSGTAPGGRWSASTLPLARWSRTAPEPVPAPLPIIGETKWSRYGSGYSGACSVLYLYRGRTAPRRP